jgi:hypothetical protein
MQRNILNHNPKITKIELKMNYGIKLDLLKLEGAFVRDLQGKTATKRCIIIPVEDNDIFVGRKGCYLDLTAIEMANPQYGETHLVKRDIPKAKRDVMTDDQRRAIPIVGGLKPIQPREQQQSPQQSPVSNAEPYNTQEAEEGGEELPF